MSEKQSTERRSSCSARDRVTGRKKKRGQAASGKGRQEWGASGHGTSNWQLARMLACMSLLVFHVREKCRVSISRLCEYTCIQPAIEINECTAMVAVQFASARLYDAISSVQPPGPGLPLADCSTWPRSHPPWLRGVPRIPSARAHPGRRLQGVMGGMRCRCCPPGGHGLP